MPSAGIGLEALPPVRSAIGCGFETKTITLSCGKLTTGVTVPQWSSILMLRNLQSPETYFQAAFRVQSPWSIKNPNGDDPHEEEILKPVCFVFDFAPTREGAVDSRQRSCRAVAVGGGDFGGAPFARVDVIGAAHGVVERRARHGRGISHVFHHLSERTRELGHLVRIFPALAGADENHQALARLCLEEDIIEFDAKGRPDLQDPGRHDQQEADRHPRLPQGPGRFVRFGAAPT